MVYVSAQVSRGAFVCMCRTFNTAFHIIVSVSILVYVSMYVHLCRCVCMHHRGYEYFCMPMCYTYVCMGVCCVCMGVFVYGCVM